MNEEKIVTQNEKIRDYNILLNNKSLVPFQWRNYLDWFGSTVEKNKLDPLYQKYFSPIIEEEKPFAGEHFLSVVMRTQGRRPEALREALLCMSAQSDQDFEVIIIAHKPEEKQKKMIRQIIDDFNPEFRAKIRFYELEIGKRSMPLNFGFAHSRGEYIAIFDDDDIVFEDWVREYHNAAKEFSGAVLHAYVLSQTWEVINTPGDAKALRAIDAPKSTYCMPFNLISQLDVNRCPPIGLAFPRIAFSEFGFHFDEEMTTTEDWDFFMRVAMIFGVKDICTPTSIYRFWQNAESSSTVHKKEEWDINYCRVQSKLKECILFANPNDVALIMNNYRTAYYANEIIRTNQDIGCIVNSFSFRIGRAITFIPRLFRDFVKEVSLNGWKKAFSFVKGKFPGVINNFKNLFRRMR